MSNGLFLNGVGWMVYCFGVQNDAIHLSIAAVVLWIISIFIRIKE